MYAQSESGVITSMFVIDREYDVCPVGKPQFDMKYRVVAAIVNNTNTDGYDFEHLKKDVCDNKGFMQKIKDTFAKKK